MAEMNKILNGAEAALMEVQEKFHGEPVEFTPEEVSETLRAVRVLRNVEYLIEKRAKFIRDTAEKLAAGEYVSDSTLELMKGFAEAIQIMKEMLDA